MNNLNNNKINNKKMKRHSFLSRAAMMLLVMLLSTVTAWAWDGQGTQSNPYKIASVSDLNTLRSQSASNNFDGVYFELTSDIAFNSSQSNNFSPIASGSYYFQGVLNGNGHTISGVRMSISEMGKGLFGAIGGNGVVKNLKVTNTQISAWNQSGIIASYSEGTIEDCTIGSDVVLNAINPNGSQYGSIVGFTRGGRISHCISEASITLSSADGGYNSMGGIVGELNSATIEHCVFAGTMQISSLSMNTNNCAVVGKYTSGTIRNNYYTSSSSSLEGGYNDVTFAYTVTVPSQFVVSGEQGHKNSYYNGLFFNHKYYTPAGCTFYVFPANGSGTSTFDVNRTSNNSSVAASVDNSYTMPSYDITLVFKGNMPPYDSTYDCYEVYDEGTWNMVAECVARGVDFSGKTLRMKNDVTVSTPIGDSTHPFKGIFYGVDTYDRIRTITFNATATGDYCAPFANINGATIQDVKIAGTISTNYKNASGLVGKVSGGTATIENVVSTVTISSTYSGAAYHGGLVGEVASGTLNINNCVFAGTMQGSNTSAWSGIVGKKSGTLNMTKCLFVPASVSVNNSGSYSLVNSAANTMIYCYYATALGTTQGKFAYKAALPEAVVPTNSSAGVYYNGNLYIGSGDVANLQYVVTSGQEGVTIAAMTAKDASNNNVTVTANSDETYSITMPSKNITVTGVMNDLWGLAGGADGSENHPYVITSVEGLNLLATKVNDDSTFKHYEGKYFKLGADITFSHAASDTWDLENSTTSNFTPIGIGWPTFCGHFDGDNHTISGLRIYETERYVGLFGKLYTNNAEIKNVILDDARITSTSYYVGGVLGYSGDNVAQSKITNCHVKNVLVKGEYNVGGILGENNRGTVSGCTSAATVIGSGDYPSYIAGVVGRNDATLKDCFYYGDNVTCRGNYYKRSAGAITVNNGGSLQNNYYLPCTVTIGGVAYTTDNGIGRGTDSQNLPQSPQDVSANDGGLPVYAVTLNAVSNGTIAAATKAITHNSKDYFKAGATVTVTATPNDGYSISSVTYNDGSSHNITSSKTFTMPSKAVSISASFSANVFNMSYSSNNDDVLSTWNGKIARVTLSGRTLYKNGSWNTLCLPFDLTIAGSLLDGNGVVAKVFSSSSNMTDGVMRLDFINAPATIPAGTPFIIKWTSGSNISDPVFTGVTINNAAPVAAVSNDGNLTFAGSFNPVANSADLMFDEHNSTHGACHVTLQTAEPTRTGYTLTGGWNTAADGTGDDVTTIPFDVLVYAKGTKNVLTLADNADNSTDIAAVAADGKVYEVTLSGRTLQAGGWNTFCAPFEINSAQIESVFGAGVKVRELSSSSLTNDVLTLNFAEATTIEAGKPYLVKVASTVADPVFNGVSIVDGTTTTETTEVNFVPVMNPTELTAGDKSVLFIKGGNTLTFPTATANMNGFRAYFQLLNANNARSFNMNFDDGETTALKLVNSEERTVNSEVYDLQGRKVANPTKGLYIINGKKVVK